MGEPGEGSRGRSCPCRPPGIVSSAAMVIQAAVVVRAAMVVRAAIVVPAKGVLRVCFTLSCALTWVVFGCVRVARR